jgi:beta-galactosidase
MDRRKFLFLIGTGISNKYLPNFAIRSGTVREARSAAPENVGRKTLSLNGTWEIEDSVSADVVPNSFAHKVDVPGLIHSSTPAFQDVDDFDGSAWIRQLSQVGRIPESDLGRFTEQQRRYFWYRTTFVAPSVRQLARLKVNKAQFGTAVWLNGSKIGEHWSCFTAGHFDLSKTVRWSAENELVIRVGALPGVLPPGVIAGIDWEKEKWTPGIYDEVSVHFCDSPAIESVQVAPRISPREILVQTRVKNYTPERLQAVLRFAVRASDSGPVMQSHALQISLEAGAEKEFEVKIPLPDARLWWPEDPQLYDLEVNTGADTAKTRFGMREFRFDTSTQRAYLNGQLYFLRGSNITLHRFFEDPVSDRLPWDESWVRKLLTDNPKRMSWNCFRFCIGPVPDKWLDIADEEGLLVQYEYPIWTGPESIREPEISRVYDKEQLTQEFTEWVRDNWNHPSVAIWDASNESWFPDLAGTIVPEVRKLDLSERPWENSYNLPCYPNDPVEQHPYLFEPSPGNRIRISSMEDLESRSGADRAGSGPPVAHALILNEYGWLWVNRDGSPTTISKKVWERLLPSSATSGDRLQEYAYLIAGLTEYWRAYRHFAAVMHFVYLTYSAPYGATSDSFKDVASLKLESHFEEYMANAFRPIGVYINFWHPAVQAGTVQKLEVMMINDYMELASGELSIVLEDDNGRLLASMKTRFELPGLGQQTYCFDFQFPQSIGKCWLKATANPSSGRDKRMTISRRHLQLTSGS